jgi:hypothetical protein
VIALERTVRGVRSTDERSPRLQYVLAEGHEVRPSLSGNLDLFPLV